MLLCTTIIQELRESCEIDWYLQAQLAYNKRFGDKLAIDDNIDSKLDKKQSRKSKPKGSFSTIPQLFQR